MKRTLIYIAATLALIGVGVGVYLFFFSGKATLITIDTAFLPGSDSGAQNAGSATFAQELGVPVAGAGTEVSPRLIRITDRPTVDGIHVIYRPGKTVASTTTVGSSTPAYSEDPEVSVSYIERESGNVYEFKAHARTLTRLSNKTLPGIYTATWTPDGSTAFTQFLDSTGGTESVTTYALPRTGEGGYTLEKNIDQIVATGNTSLITLTKRAEGSVATLADLSSNKTVPLFSSQLSNLLLSNGKGTTIATTKPSASLGGYVFLVDPKNGSFTRVLGPLNGLSAQVSPSGEAILYSYVSSGKITLAVFSMKQRSAVRLPLATLADKCAWSADSASVFCAVPTTLSGTFPDDWYQGAAHTSDRLWRVSLSDRVATQIVDLETVGAGSIDATTLTSDGASDVLVFINRNDGTLWLYDL